MYGVVEDAFRRHYGRVYRYVRRRAATPEDAEDLAQSVFAAAATSLPVLARADADVLPWLYTVAKRRFADEARRRARTARAAELADVPREYDEFVAGEIRAALARLPDEQRRVLVMKLIRGLPFAEIAGDLGTSEGAAGMRFSRALRALRAELETRGVTP